MQGLRKGVQVLGITVLLAGLSTGCLATRKFTRNEVKTSSDALSAQIEATNAQVKETQDSVNLVNNRVTQVDQRVSTVDQRVTSVDGKVTDLDGRTTQSVNTLKTDVSSVNTKADAASRNVTDLNTKFQNRNNYTVSDQKAVLFRFDSATLTDENKSSLDEIAKAITENPNAILVLEGHTDSTGDQTYNIRLGERRIESVRRYLAVDKGVPVYKIEEISFGAEKPIAPNDSREGREQNRAVTLSILVPMSEGAAAVVRE
jgi:outer membrane protein OmpA-like peptidoglycan-associated protein